MNLKQILDRVPGTNRRFIYYLESQGYIRPTRLPKERIDRRDYGEADLRVIQDTWRYYRQGFALQAAYNLAVVQEHIIAYVAFQAPAAARAEVLRRLRQVPEVVEASVVYAEGFDFVVKLAAPREADFYEALVPLFAATGVTGVPAIWRTVKRHERDLGQEDEPAMMAYVLIKVPGKNVDGVMEVLQGLEGVAEASTVYGESDIVARVEVPSQDHLDSLVMKHIHGIAAVESTRTYIVIGGMHWQRERGAGTTDV